MRRATTTTSFEARLADDGADCDQGDLISKMRDASRKVKRTRAQLVQPYKFGVRGLVGLKAAALFKSVVARSAQLFRQSPGCFCV